MYNFDPHTMLVILVLSAVSVGSVCLATRVIKINLFVALLLSIISGIVSAHLGSMSYLILMFWFGNWVNPLLLGLALPRYSLLNGLLTNTTALILITQWIGKDSESGLLFWLIGLSTSLLVTVPIFYFGYWLPLQRAAGYHGGVQGDRDTL